MCTLLIACFSSRRRSEREGENKRARVNFSSPDEFLGLFELVEGGLVEKSIGAVEAV